MSYSVHAYLVPLERLQLVYGCHDRGVGQAMERTFAARLQRDETPREVVVIEPGALTGRSEITPPPVPTLRQALYDIIAGTLRPNGDAAQYLYAMELFCAHLGTVLDNAAFIGINGIAIVEEFVGLEALVRHSRVPSPLPQVPLPRLLSDWPLPSVTYLTPQEATAALEQWRRLTPQVLSAQPAWRSWDEDYIEDAYETYRSWLEEAVASHQNLIAFLY